MFAAAEGHAIAAKALLDAGAAVDVLNAVRCRGSRGRFGSGGKDA